MTTLLLISLPHGFDIEYYYLLTLSVEPITLIWRCIVNKERFAEILKEYGFTDRQIELLWDTRPSGNLDEQKLRKTAEHIAPIKDTLAQA